MINPNDLPEKLVNFLVANEALDRFCANLNTSIGDPNKVIKEFKPGDTIGDWLITTLYWGKDSLYWFELYNKARGLRT